MRMRMVAIVTLVALLAVLFPVSIANAQVVNFPDPNLEAAIREAIAKPSGDILQSDLATLSHLGAESRGISDLTGLQFCTNLTALALYNNEISNLTPLAGLTNLAILSLHGNLIDDLTALSGIVSLTHLQLDWNQISDVSPLSGLSSLQYLQLGGNQIADILPLASLTNVTHLGISWNRVNNLTPISVLDGLTDLHTELNRIVDISPLLNMDGLGTVYVGYNPLNAESYDTYIPQLEAAGVSMIYTAANTLASSPPGSPVVVDLLADAPPGPGAMWLTFSNVTAKGRSEFNGFFAPLPEWGQLPVSDGYRITGGGVFVDIVTGAVYSGPVSLESHYTESDLANPDRASLWYWDGSWHNGSLQVFPDQMTVTIQLPALYPFFGAEPASDVSTATNTGTATLLPGAGSVQNLTAVAESSLPSTGKPALEFPHGFFEFNITGLTPGESVTLTIELPSAVPTTTQYWKYGPTPGDPSPHWYQIPMGSNDGDNIITITLVDGGLGDDDLTANGVIVDQGGPGGPPGGGGGATSAPVFPNVYIGVAAAFAAAILAFGIRKRLVRQAQ